MEIGDALLLNGFIFMIGLFLFQQSGLRNYFKKENFKIKKSNILATNKLQLRKLERELGLTKSKDVQPIEAPSTMDSLKSLLPLLNKLAPEQIQGLIEQFIPGAEPDEGGAVGGIDSLIDFATKNPELVQGFLKGVKGGAGGQEEAISQV